MDHTGPMHHEKTRTKLAEDISSLHLHQCAGLSIFHVPERVVVYIGRIYRVYVGCLEVRIWCLEVYMGCLEVC